MWSLLRALTVVLTMLSVLAARAPAEPAGKRIAHLTPSIADAFLGQMARSLTMRSELLGMSVTTFSGGRDAARQLRQMDEAIELRYDLIALTVGSRAATRDLLRRAKDAGIPVVLLSTPPVADRQDQFLSAIGEDRRALGRLAGTALLDALRRSGRVGGNVAVIAGPLGQAESALRLEGFKQSLSSANGIEIVAVEDAGWMSSGAAKAAARIIERYHATKRLDAIYAMTDGQAVAAIKAAESAGIVSGVGAGDLIVVASGCSKTGIDMIKAGKQHSTATEIPARVGWTAADLIADHFRGASVPKLNYLPVSAVDGKNVALWSAACTY